MCLWILPMFPKEEWERSIKQYVGNRYKSVPAAMVNGKLKVNALGTVVNESDFFSEVIS